MTTLSNHDGQKYITKKISLRKLVQEDKKIKRSIEANPFQLECIISSIAMFFNTKASFDDDEEA
jgi:hypothetical protein